MDVLKSGWWTSEFVFTAGIQLANLAIQMNLFPTESPAAKATAFASAALNVIWYAHKRADVKTAAINNGLVLPPVPVPVEPPPAPAAPVAKASPAKPVAASPKPTAAEQLVMAMERSNATMDRIAAMLDRLDKQTTAKPLTPTNEPQTP